MHLYYEFCVWYKDYHSGNATEELLILFWIVVVQQLHKNLQGHPLGQMSLEFSPLLPVKIKVFYQILKICSYLCRNFSLILFGFSIG